MGCHQRAPRGERLQPVAHERLCELFLRAEQALQLAPDRGITVQRPVQPGEATQQCVVHRPGPDALQGQQVFGNDLGWRISLPLIERQAPFDHFARELDDVGRNGMEMGFMEVAGLCPLPDANHIDDWFASLRLGAEFLLAAQELIQLDPAQF